MNLAITATSLHQLFRCSVCLQTRVSQRLHNLAPSCAPSIVPAEPMQSLVSDSKLLRTSSFINGAFVAPSADPNLLVRNPYNDELVAPVSSVRSEQVDEALKGTSEAFGRWRRTAGLKRIAVLNRFLQLIEEHSDDLAAILVAENGKPRREALGEVKYAASYIEQACHVAYNASHGTRAAQFDAETLALIVREPIGVVLSVTPWNFPLAMLTRKLAPALAVGCTMVAKPSEYTPLSALALAELARRADVPAGVFNVLVSAQSRKICEQVLAHTDVRMVSFTGSTHVGRALCEMAAKRLQRTSMELGGLACLIVCEDADLHRAVDGLMINKFRNAGQSCVSINRAYVHAALHDEFVGLVKSRMERDVVVGDGNAPTTTVGPLISKHAVQRVRAQVENAVKLGAKLLFESAIPDDGFSNAFCAPALLVDVPDDADVLRCETFGPVLAIQRFDDYARVVDKANNTEMGLASYVYSQNLMRAHSIARALETGMVAVNNVFLSDARTCFGGVKQSGGGREGSEFCLDDFTEMKQVLVKHGSAL